MPQALLPLFPAGATEINPLVSFRQRDGVCYYFHGADPVFQQPVEDRRSFQFITAQLHINGLCTQAGCELDGVLYVDGHVRVYTGRNLNLPRRYVARQKLCLPGATDYWVNDALKHPLFSLTRTVDPGLPECWRSAPECQ